MENYLQKRIESGKFTLLAVSIGIVYVWFGVLKFFPGASPAESLAKDTIHYITFGLVPSDVSIILLAIWETVLGFLLIFNVAKKTTIWVALVHMICTFAPIFLFPDMSFAAEPFSLTLLGQYIIKNIVIISALLAIYPAKKEPAPVNVLS